MATYAVWNNKGGVGKSYLSFQLACEYARAHPEKKVLVVDLCPQSNCSSMLLGGIEHGENALNTLCSATDRRTIAGYVRERIASPYHNTRVGGRFIIRVQDLNNRTPGNLFLVVGDEELEILASRVSRATEPGPDLAWVHVHGWIRDLIEDVKTAWNGTASGVFIDCNPSFGIYTELALSAADRLIIPFSADGSSKRAVKSVLSLVYGISRMPGAQQSEFFLRSDQYNLRAPGIYCYVGNRLTQGNYKSAAAFRAVVETIGSEIWNAWRSNPNSFSVHPAGSGAPNSRREFSEMFQFEVRDANTASVVSSTLGVPLFALTAGTYRLPGKTVQVNQSQLDVLQPNIAELVQKIE